MGEREFDYVVYGASGFTGQYVVEALSRALDGSTERWALAGRNADKIRAAIAESAKLLENEKLTGLPIITADSSDELSLLQMAARTKLVLNCVGPYRLYGEPVVKACVESGTHHVDISGEPAFLEEMAARYDEKAREKKCLVIGACGWDSVPCDLGVHLTKRRFTGDLSGVETVVQIVGGPSGYKINNGTYQTMVLSMSTKDELKSNRRLIMPERLPKVAPPLPKRGVLHKNEKTDAWCVPFMGSDKSVVARSIYHAFHERNERPFEVQAYAAVGGVMWALLVGLWAALMAVLAQLGPTRRFLQNNPDLCSFGYFSKDGPSRKQASEARFTYWFFGRGWSSKAPSVDEAHDGAPDAAITVKCDGPDPGYNATAACIVAAATTIVGERQQLPEGGVFTPASALGDTRIYEKLAAAGITFEVTEPLDREE